ncbi:helix-turn-helix transcriptional regulator [Allonocardiopsis opalescens]|nr:YafY family protein [Allonocardiopsis opalescens]
MADASRRMLALLSLLQDGGGWSGEELAERLGVSRRTLRRDVDRLRSLGYPVHTRPGPGGHYRLAAGTALPPLLLDDEEAIAVAVGVRLAARTSAIADVDDSAATRALRKLEQVLPARLRPRVAAAHEGTEIAPDPGAQVPAGLLADLGGAVRRHERVRFTYRDRDGADTRRRAEPYRQVLLRRRWYLLAWDTERADWRSFRLDRVSGLVRTGQYFTPRELPAESAADYLAAAFRARRHRAVLTLHAPAEQVADRLRAQDGVLEPLTDGACRLTAWVDSFEWLATVVLTLGVDFDITEPDAFRSYCARLRERLDRAVG